jgi:hypothetical protein
MARNGVPKNCREAAALALAGGRNVRDTAADTGIGSRTLFRWLQDSAFRIRVAELRSQLFEHAVGKLAHLAGNAVDTLANLLHSQSESVRLQAAKAILDAGPRLRENVELSLRVTELSVLLERPDANARPVEPDVEQPLMLTHE